MAVKKTTAKKVKAAPKKAKVKYPEKFTANGIADYISEKHELPKKQSKEILEDLYDVIEAGVIQGERVPIGKIGKAFVRVKPATKARKGRNPLTGEEIMIAAKKATKVPKFSFTKDFKEKSVKAKIKKK
ncbi:MAG: HU family DNA-binding protein [bacterium]|nr:HU family DNA-binding protein [bacterium]